MYIPRFKQKPFAFTDTVLEQMVLVKKQTMLQVYIQP